MPRLCITLLALLLLPQARSCNRRNLTDDYITVVSDDIKIVERNITSMLQDSVCPPLKGKLPNCSLQGDEVHSILKLIDKMSSLMPSLTEDLAETILQSVRTNCPAKLELRPTAAPRERRTSEIKKLCKIKAILSSMTLCYQVLNSKSQDH